MKRRRPLKGLAALCGEIHPEDGIDPRYSKSCRGRSRNETDNRKTRQLCKQILHAVSIALRGELSDPVLQDLDVVRVEPGRDASCVVVMVCLSPTADAICGSEVLHRITSVRGFLRAQVAAAITRKQVPELVFRLVECAGDID